jgi:hypothetical protein
MEQFHVETKIRFVITAQDKVEAVRKANKEIRALQKRLGGGFGIEEVIG